MAHEAQPPDSGAPGGWLPPAAPGSMPPPAPPPAPQAYPPYTYPPQQAPWASTLYYNYREPGNDAGVAGFCLSLGAVILLLITFGIACVLSLPMSIAGIALSVRGRRRFIRQETS